MFVEGGGDLPYPLLGHHRRFSAVVVTNAGTVPKADLTAMARRKLQRAPSKIQPVHAQDLGAFLDHLVRHIPASDQNGAPITPQLAGEMPMRIMHDEFLMRRPCFASKLCVER